MGPIRVNYNDEETIKDYAEFNLPETCSRLGRGLVYGELIDNGPILSHKDLDPARDKFRMKHEDFYFYLWHMGKKGELKQNLGMKPVTGEEIRRMFFSHDWYKKYGEELEKKGIAERFELKYLSNGNMNIPAWPKEDLKPRYSKIKYTKWKPK